MINMSLLYNKKTPTNGSSVLLSCSPSVLRDYFTALPESYGHVIRAYK